MKYKVKKTCLINRKFIKAGTEITLSKSQESDPKMRRYINTHLIPISPIKTPPPVKVKTPDPVEAKTEEVKTPDPVEAKTEEVKTPDPVEAKTEEVKTTPKRRGRRAKKISE